MKILYAAGIFACLVAVYNLSNILNLFLLINHPSASMLGGFLLISFASIVLFVRAWMGKLSAIEKKIGVIVLFGSALWISRFSAFSPILWTTNLFLAASVCLLFADTRNEFGVFFETLKKLLSYGHAVVFMLILLGIGHDPLLTTAQTQAAEQKIIQMMATAPTRAARQEAAQMRGVLRRISTPSAGQISPPVVKIESIVKRCR